MISYGWMLTLVGMGSVFAFLWLLMLVIQFSSWIIRKYESSSEGLDKVALAIVVGLKERK